MFPYRFFLQCCYHTLRLFDLLFRTDANKNLSKEGEDLARQFNCAFIETSAKSRINVDTAFYNIVREIRRYNKEMAYPSGPSTNNGSPHKTTPNHADDERGCCGGKCMVM